MSIEANYKKYERLVRDILEREIRSDAPTARISVDDDQKILGRSGAMHQVDVVADVSIAGFHFRVIAECKFRSTRLVEKKDVLALSKTMEEISAHKGLIVTTIGFQEGAETVAESYKIGLVTLAPDSHTWKVVLPLGLVLLLPRQMRGALNILSRSAQVTPVMDTSDEAGVECDANTSTSGNRCDPETHPPSDDRDEESVAGPPETASREAIQNSFRKEKATPAVTVPPARFKVPRVRAPQDRTLVAYGRRITQHVEWKELHGVESWFTPTDSSTFFGHFGWRFWPWYYPFRRWMRDPDSALFRFLSEARWTKALLEAAQKYSGRNAFSCFPSGPQFSLAFPALSVTRWHAFLLDEELQEQVIAARVAFWVSLYALPGECIDQMQHDCVGRNLRPQITRMVPMMYECASTTILELRHVALCGVARFTLELLSSKMARDYEQELTSLFEFMGGRQLVASENESQLPDPRAIMFSNIQVWARATNRSRISSYMKNAIAKNGWMKPFVQPCLQFVI